MTARRAMRPSLDEAMVKPGALAAAALIEGVVESRDARVGVILSGGNVDLGLAGQWFGDASTVLI